MYTEFCSVLRNKILSMGTEQTLIHVFVQRAVLQRFTLRILYGYLFKVLTVNEVLSESERIISFVISRIAHFRVYQDVG